nr:unnamed protein product [Digitaria exilis]
MKDNNEPPVTEKATDTSEVMLDIPDFSLLKHMRSEEITNFLKSEWLKLRRQHESVLHQKTEELFRVKREYAKAKASLPLKKERELEFIKSKLLQTISKLGEITSRKDNSCFECNENEEMCRLKDRISMLLHENNRLRGLLADKREEVKDLYSQISDAKSKMAQQSLPEARLLNSFEKLKVELEDLKIERHLNNLLDSCIFREAFDDYENQIYDMNKEGSFLKELLDENEDQLGIIYEDRQKLKLTSIICQSNSLVQQVTVLRKKEFWYKQILEIKCSNLRKAEAEVDLLGDEVDTLLSVLGKIYIALDHYSPVLKHYPGVTAILILVQKVLKGENV